METAVGLLDRSLCSTSHLAHAYASTRGSAPALRTPVLSATAAISLASAIWYGLITILAFRAGSDWEAVAGAIGRLARNTGLIALALSITIVAVVWYRRRGRKE